MTAGSTVQDVHTVMRTLRRGYPAYHPEIDEETVKVWHGKLAGYPPSVLADVASAWIGGEARFPSLAEFLRDVRAAVRREREMREAEVRALAPPVSPPPPGVIAALRAVLRSPPES